MKFAIFATVVFALAAIVQSSVISPLAVTGPGGAIAAPGSIAVQASAANGPHAAVAIKTIPHIVAVAPAAVAVAPVVAGGATYVAKNRGVLHVAPLEGHVQSAVSLNLQAAPGTL